jgi:hypothetical protein
LLARSLGCLVVCLGYFFLWVRLLARLLSFLGNTLFARSLARFVCLFLSAHCFRVFACEQEEGAGGGDAQRGAAAEAKAKKAMMDGITGDPQ